MIRTFALGIVTTALLSAAVGRAEEDDTFGAESSESDTGDDLPNLRPLVIRIWLQPPFTNATFSKGAGSPFLDYGSGSAGVELFGRFPVEIGGGDFAGSNLGALRSLDLWLRGGVVTLGAGRERGLAHQFVFLAGYRLVAHRQLITFATPDTIEDHTGTEFVHALTFDLGSQWTLWFSKSFGICARALGGIVIPVYTAHSDAWADSKMRRAFDRYRLHAGGHLAFEAGVAF